MERDNEQRANWEDITIPGLPEAEQNTPAEETRETLLPEILSRLDPDNKTVNMISQAFILEIAAFLGEQAPSAPGSLSDVLAQDPLFYESAKKELQDVLDRLTGAFMSALRVLAPLKGKYADPVKNIYIGSAESGFSIKHLSAVYFFARHNEIDPCAAVELTEQQTQELQDIFKRLDAFYCERSAEGPIPAGNLNVFYDFFDRDKATLALVKRVDEVFEAVEPKDRKIINNSLMNRLCNHNKPGMINDGEGNVSFEKGKQTIKAYSQISFYPGESGLKFENGRMSEYDNAVANALFTLWRAAGKPELLFVYPDMIYRCMPGAGTKPGTKQRQAIRDAVERLRRLFLKVNISELVEKWHLDFSKKPLDDFFITAIGGEAREKRSGKMVKGWWLRGSQLVFSFFEATNQILTVPPEAYRIQKTRCADGRYYITGQTIPMTTPRQEMANYMIRKIAQMKLNRRNGNKDPNYSKIRYSQIFQAAGLTDQTRKDEHESRQFCLDVLKSEAAQGIIKGFREYPADKRTKFGVDIELTPREEVYLT